MVFDSRERAKKYTPSDGDTLEKIAQRECDAGNEVTWEEIAKFNWGTADKAIVNEHLRDELGARLRDSKNNFVISANNQPGGGLLIPIRYKNNNLTANKRIVLHVIQQPAPSAQFLECAAIPGITFEFDKSFIRPSVAKPLAALKEARANNPSAKFVVFGHTDKVGDDAYNKKLSERRAKSVYALMVSDVEIWEQLYKAENWGIKVIQEILQDFGGTYHPGAVDGKIGPKTETAIKQYQKDRGLSVDGYAGPRTRKKIFAEYMGSKHDMRFKPDDFLEPKHIGCGEFNPVVETKEANESNRRVVFYLFNPQRPPKFPCQAESIAPCVNQMAESQPRFRASFGCSFYDSLSAQCSVESAAEEVVYSQSLIALSPIDGSAQTTSYKLYQDQTELEKGKTGSDGVSSRRQRSVQENLIALAGPTGEWQVDLLTFDTPFPVDWDDAELELAGEEN